MKNTLLKGLLYLACCVVIFGMMGCEESMQRSASGETQYLKYNFHYATDEKGEISGSIANYTSLPNGKILPYGSAVKIARSRSGFVLIDEKSGRKIDILAPSRFLGGKSLSDYLDLILSETPLSYADISEIDRKGISEGKPYKGMSKKGIMIALGYPCPHRTPSPDADVWYYWRDRFRSYDVNFENDMVASSGY